MVARYQSSALRKAPPTRTPSAKFFKPGNKGGPGRPKASPNRYTALLKDDILNALNRAGSLKPIWEYKEGKTVKRGKKWITLPDVKVRIIAWEPTGEEGGGSEGYLIWLACNHPTAFAALLGRTLPLQINANAMINETVTSRFSDVDIGKMTLAEKQAAMREMLGLTRALPPPDPDANPRMIEGKATRVSEE